MSKKIAVLMDPIENINPNHDTSFALILAAQHYGWQCYYFQQQQLYCDNGIVKAKVQQVTVAHEDNYYQLQPTQTMTLADLDCVLMRKDPPFNMQYIYSTYLLELAQAQGCKVYNNPQSLRDANEKLFTLWFPELCPANVVSSDKTILKQFWQQQGDIILKPIDGMGGRGIFYAAKQDPNINSMIETLTEFGAVPIMAQQYQPEIKTHGDCRIIIINGEPVEQVLVRMPSTDDIRGNMVAHAETKVEPINSQQLAVCKQLQPMLKQKGLFFVGLDMIGDKVTEINVTSPTGIQEIDRHANMNLGERFVEQLATLL